MQVYEVLSVTLGWGGRWARSVWERFRSLVWAFPILMFTFVSSFPGLPWAPRLLTLPEHYPRPQPHLTTFLFSITLQTSPSHAGLRLL